MGGPPPFSFVKYPLLYFVKQNYVWLVPSLNKKPPNLLFSKGLGVRSDQGGYKPNT